MYTALLYIGVAFFAWLAVFLDSKLFDRKTKKPTYIKIIILSLLLVFISQKITININTSTATNVDIGKIIGKQTKYLPDLGEEMISGVPNF